MENKKLPALYYNWISLLGSAVALVSFSIIAFLYVLDLTTAQSSPYFGIITYMILPVGVLLGLILIPIGMLHERRNRRDDIAPLIPYTFTVDFTNKKQRNAFAGFLVITAIFLIGTAVGSYQAYHYTETVEFCGQVCHNIMEPEYVAYKQSPHARVTCAECHVGEGASWYVKSKMSGAYQVYAAIANVYPRPIPTPVENLRPARETCEQCHWPDKFYGSRQKEIHRYMADENNTRWTYNLLIDIGGKKYEGSKHSGIHWHIDNEVEYIARDSARQDIPWVKVTYEDGSEEVYESMYEPLADSTIEEAETRVMDCIDCHNRPTHIYRTPVDLVDNALYTGEISPKLPYIKQQAVYALRADYTEKDSALTKIEEQIRSFYRENYPNVQDSLRAELNQAISTVQEKYRNNFFPYMKVRWDTHPNNVGHSKYLGCYRCHNGYMANESGNNITHECTACHVILEQGTPGDMEFAENDQQGLEFEHPMDIGGAWQSMACTDCHDGGGAVF
ncbi:MAG: NapC/NirT family cytochrome c [Candidatus Marinimicrobia bacterium]|nr:NapC/NirT family cytochrome c [Candidatus Neomarinimicrobiota bacterium]MCF7830186.1 NapC/NirT family cytochrome c [Candidatus Neomarinimicrobiota bacterium]MCF7882080.1 NapC/NirT family cytochrome c [Candidatus Neomarinimicrobiota bacterium]